MTDPRRALPSVEAVLAHLMSVLDRDDALPRLAHEQLATCARAAIATARDAIESGRPMQRAGVLDLAVATARSAVLAALQPVVNATGVLLHTNLGRAPLGHSTRDAMVDAMGYTNIEFNLATGTRGSRHDHAGHLFAMACGAEAGIVVNNNAAAIVLVLAALARGREVVVSRGELVEIGGGFRVPEILAETGARLVEVGTTNRTRANDYARAINDDTAMLLKVHASNYRMVGFTAAAPVAELAALGVRVVVDAGSGLLDSSTPWLPERPSWLGDEPGVRQALADGADLVTFSGDKLLGGPQAGIIVGSAASIADIKQHPLARAMRCDKVTLAGLQAVARAYLDRDATAIPLWRMAATTIPELEARAATIVAAVRGAVTVETEAAAGGGSLPGLTIPSIGVALATHDTRAALQALRVDHRIVAVARDGQVVCDLRSVDPTDDERLIRGLAAVAP